MVLENSWKTVFIQVKIKLTIGYLILIAYNRIGKSNQDFFARKSASHNQRNVMHKKMLNSFVFLDGVFSCFCRLYLPGHCYKLFLFSSFTQMFNIFFLAATPGHPFPMLLVPSPLQIYLPWSGTRNLHAAVLAKPWRPMLCHSRSRPTLLSLLKAFYGTYCISFNVKSIPHNVIHAGQGQKKS